MRPWLLGLVCILLVADGYWASRNLVMKSADDGIYWFYTQPPQRQLVVELKPTTSNSKIEKQPMLEWNGSQWRADGKTVSDVRTLVKYWRKGDRSNEIGCGLDFYMGTDATIKEAITAIGRALEAGANEVTVLAPRVEWGRRKAKSILFFHPPHWTTETCPYANDWRDNLENLEVGYGYPPKVTATK